MSSERVSRRSVIVGLVVTGAAGIAGYFVADNSSVAKAKGAAGYSAGSGGSAGASSGGQRLVSLDQVPPQGGVVLAQRQIVLTRDGGDTVHGFSAICTHLGCTVDSVENGTIMCPCHGSRFDAQTGAVRAGPATRPLPAVPVTVRGSSVYTG
ncbi:MAG TPA: Rieske (2Fe-2S) protein [Acidimicrobiales bacterium]|nr:Rieske (2Fe-2S) protein [Acidimicrobiales bacterium]